MRMNIRSVLKSISIEKVASHRERYLSGVFSSRERKYLEGRHVRTTAGWLALKYAVAELKNTGKERTNLQEDVSLLCLDNGRPVITRVDFLPGFTDNLFVSISHSRTMAYGLAVWQEG